MPGTRVPGTRQKIMYPGTRASNWHFPAGRVGSGLQNLAGTRFGRVPAGSYLYPAAPGCVMWPIDAENCHFVLCHFPPLHSQNRHRKKREEIKKKLVFCCKLQVIHLACITTLSTKRGQAGLQLQGGVEGLRFFTATAKIIRIRFHQGWPRDHHQDH